ncbi:MAG: alkaline phosphatase [Candidatus Hydrogenedentes bacterium]|nr:alkaline phosphatase [Candidatus Hydrogenedentota bacterium]
MKFMSRAYLILLLAACSARAQVACVEHVVVVGVDGLAPFGIEAAETPVLDSLMRRGAYTMHARAVMPTSSSSNWASMIMGAGPEQHGVTSNDWQPDKHEIEPVAKGPGGIFPTIFSAMREQRPDAHIAVLHHWDGFGRLLERDLVDFIANPKTEDLTAQRASEYILEHKPAFLFVHLDHVDHAGHETGWRSTEYNVAVEKADRLIGQILKAVDNSSIADRTIVLVVSDHGGKNKSHGGSTMDEIEIPWIIAGPGIAAGKEISAPVDTYQTAATIAYIFGIKQPDAWIARPVLEAFASK